MRRLPAILIAVLAMACMPLASGAAADTAKCTPDDIAAAVDDTGGKLRRYTMETNPQLQPRLKALAAKNGWGEEGYEEAAFQHLKDDRIKALDETAGGLLARIDQLGELKPGAEADCERLEGIRVAGIELLAVMKAKTSHVMAKIDAELGTKPQAVAAVAPPASTSSGASAPAPSPAPPTAAAARPAQGSAPAAAQSSSASKSVDAPAGAKPATAPATGSWSAKTSPWVPGAPPASGSLPAPAVGTPVPPVETRLATAPPVAEPPGASGAATGVPRPSVAMNAPPPTLSGEDGYSIEEIRDATRGFFGGVSTGLAAVIEHAFRKSGRPTGYVLGQEGGGAFFGGLRYGKGTLYLRAGGSLDVYWHGPSLGFDFGASGTRTMFLVYKLRERDEIFRVFSGIDGSAFVVGGVGVTLLTGGGMILAPIRSGLGVRLGANIGYLRFTPQQTWNPL